MNRKYKILFCDSYLTVYSDYFNEAIVHSSRGFHCDCDTYGSYEMQAYFHTNHEALNKADDHFCCPVAIVKK